MKELIADVKISQLLLLQMRLQLFSQEMVINFKTPVTSSFTIGMANLFSASVKCIQCTFPSIIYYCSQLASWGGI
jgi:hypothetical protein